MKIQFNNDYNHGMHPNILKRLAEINNNSYIGYGLDEICDSAKSRILEKLENKKAAVHFLIGGTQANLVFIQSALKSFEGVISADSGHINVHETGAIENTGHKVIPIPHVNGKISAASVEKLAMDYENSDIPEHIVKPKMVYISFPTEFGSIYSKKELTALYQTCQKHHLILFIDGARLAYGLGCKENDLTFSDLGKLCDAFYIGGTKCGAMFGEAMVINNPLYQEDFRSYIKQLGAMLAKGFLLGVQFDELFKDDLYFKIGVKANLQAIKIKEAFLSKGYPMYIDSPTNQLFVTLPNSILPKFDEKYIFEKEYYVDENHTCVRFCTSFSTTDEEVETLVKDILTF